MTLAKHLTMVQEVALVVMVGSGDTAGYFLPLAAESRGAIHVTSLPHSCKSPQQLTHLSACKPSKRQ